MVCVIVRLITRALLLLFNMKENRDYGAKYGSGAYAVAMRDMVKSHRNHPSIIVWSFCNEVECEQFDAA